MALILHDLGQVLVGCNQIINRILLLGGKLQFLVGGLHSVRLCAGFVIFHASFTLFVFKYHLEYGLKDTV